MAEKREAAPVGTAQVADPDNVPIAHATGVVSALVGGQTILMNFIGDRMAVGLDGSTRPDLIVAARLRFDLNVARRIRDQLDAYLNGEVIEGPGPNQKLN